MNFLISPNAFKGTLSASEASLLIKQAIGGALPEARVDVLPIAEGGDGTGELLIDL